MEGTADGELVLWLLRGVPLDPVLAGEPHPPANQLEGDEETRSHSDCRIDDLTWRRYLDVASVSENPAAGVSWAGKGGRVGWGLARKSHT